MSEQVFDSQAAFGTAMANHQRGALGEAERAYAAILAKEPAHMGATYLLGVVFLQQGKFAAAERQIAAAIGMNPGLASAHEHRGEALLNSGRAAEAAAAFEKAIALKPDFLEAHANRAVALRALGRRQDALAAYEKAIALKPDHAAALIGRGAVLHELGRTAEALASYDAAIAAAPQSAEAFNNRGNALTELDRFEEALQSFTRAIALNPVYAEAFSNRGHALRRMGRGNEALHEFERAIALKPDYAEAFYNRGLVLHEAERVEEALASYDRAIAFKPSYAEAFDKRGNALKDLKRLDEALAAYGQAITLKPDYHEAIDNRGRCSFLLGRLAEGWTDYESRWKKPGFLSVRPPLDAPHWKGESLANRSILVYMEQGLGDAIQFCRYLPVLAERGANVSFLLPRNLTRLIASLRAPIRFLEALGKEDRFDFQCPLMSLPHLLKLPLAGMEAPYLSADGERAADWRARLGADGFKIGICWQANPLGGGRSFPLASLFPLSQIARVRLISLQKNFGLGQLDTRPNGMQVETLGADYDAGDFLETAGVVESLNMVVTCDTSIAHLAGALGRPVWTALKYVPDWRWMLERGDSPWYPTMRLFRQKTPNDWAPVFAEICEALEAERL